jgi:hypothetical protein
VLLRAVRRVRAIYHLEREEHETIKKIYGAKKLDKNEMIILANSLK